MNIKLREIHRKGFEIQNALTQKHIVYKFIINEINIFKQNKKQLNSISILRRNKENRMYIFI